MCICVYWAHVHAPVRIDEYSQHLLIKCTTYFWNCFRNSPWCGWKFEWIARELLRNSWSPRSLLQPIHLHPPRPAPSFLTVSCAGLWVMTPSFADKVADLKILFIVWKNWRRSLFLAVKFIRDAVPTWKQHPSDAPAPRDRFRPPPPSPPPVLFISNGGDIHRPDRVTTWPSTWSQSAKRFVRSRQRNQPAQRGIWCWRWKSSVWTTSAQRVIWSRQEKLKRRRSIHHRPKRQKRNWSSRWLGSGFRRGNSRRWGRVYRRRIQTASRSPRVEKAETPRRQTNTRGTSWKPQSKRRNAIGGRWWWSHCKRIPPADRHYAPQHATWSVTRRHS